MDPSNPNWMSMMTAGQMPPPSSAPVSAAGGLHAASFLPDYWNAGFPLPTVHMPFIPASTHLTGFNSHSSPIDPSNGQHKMSMKMDIKNEYGDTYGTSEMYAAGVASMGGDHFNNPLADQQDHQYELSSASLSAVQSGGASGDLLMGLASGDVHSFQSTSNLTKEQLNSQQEAIRAHPLYPLLTVLFERCELATSTPRDLSKEVGCRPESASEMFKDDLMHFVKSRQDEKMHFYVPDPELDKLMLSAIQVLRLHLLELEKVHELCDHFCQRYVGTLKEQMQLEMMHDERASSAATNNASPGSPSVGPSSVHQQQYQLQQPAYEPQIVNLPESMHGQQLLPHGQSSDTSASSSAYAGNGQEHLQSQSQQPTTSASSVAHTPGSSDSHSRNGSTPNTTNQHAQSLMHDDTGDDNLSINESLHDEGRDSPSSDHHVQNNGHQLNSSGEASSTNQRSTSASSSTTGKRKVPKVFSKEAITKFRAWLFQNLQHPYPSEEQKKQLAHETNLTILQVNNWAGQVNNCQTFRNRRRRNSDASPNASPNNADTTALNTSTNSTSTTLPNSFSPSDASASMMNAMTASAAHYPAMFQPYGFPAQAFPSQMFVPNVAAYSMNSGTHMTNTDWINFNGGSMDS